MNKSTKKWIYIGGIQTFTDGTPFKIVTMKQLYKNKLQWKYLK